MPNGGFEHQHYAYLGCDVISYIIREAVCKPTRRLDHCVQTPSRERRNDVCGFVRAPIVASKVVELFPGTWRDSIVDTPPCYTPSSIPPENLWLKSCCCTPCRQIYILKFGKKEMNARRTSVFSRLMKGECIFFFFFFFFFFFDAVQPGLRLYISI